MPPKFKFNSIDQIKRPSVEMEIEAYKKQGEDFVNSHRRLLNSFAEDVSLRFKMEDQFLIDYENGVVQLDSKWFFERGYNKEQILWAVFHELSHFRDFATDKEGLLASFEYMKGKADTLSKETEMDPQLAYKTYHTLFNCLDDVYVNKVVSRRASYYESKRQGGKHVEDLYREKLFKDSDFTNVQGDDGSISQIPRHLQFAYYLLRKAMLPSEEIVVDAEVREALDTQITVGNKEYDVESLIHTFMVPGRTDAKASARHEYLKRYIQPIYEALIQKDVNENKDSNPEDKKNDGSNPNQDNGQEQNQGNESPEQKNQESTEDKGQSENKNPEDQGTDKSQSGSGNEDKKSDGTASNEQQNTNSTGTSSKERQEQKFKEWSNIHEKFESQSPDQLNEDEIKKFTERKEEEKAKDAQKDGKVKEQPKSERAFQENLDKDWANQHEIQGRNIYQELRSLRRIEESILPYLNDLTELWQNIITGSSIEITHTRDSAHSSGFDLNIDSVIDNMGAIYAGQSSPRIYDKVITKESTVEKPEVIRVRLVVDKSGSMDDETKQNVLAKTLVLILRSLQQFNEMLNLTRGSTGSKLKVETQVLGFSNTLSIIKKLDSESGEEDPTIEILNTLKQSGAENGNTYDHVALNHILETQDEVSKQRIQQGKILDILFEITDGGSSDAGATQEAVKKMVEVGVHASAFQIGQVGRSEERAFNYAWNSDENEKRGMVVGVDMQKLLPVLSEALKKYLGGVKI
ncbi:hypothetical protein IPH92_02970 [Candidatus Kaiserbacteria bacterium]|nr:MAG: hypothetical protein IPH92_02970 [Candidatus Kaiserbacteria bacterium]